jgi:hypothetical protein
LWLRLGELAVLRKLLMLQMGLLAQVQPLAQVLETLARETEHQDQEAAL